jgi:hypothetical protein
MERFKKRHDELERLINIDYAIEKAVKEEYYFANPINDGRITKDDIKDLIDWANEEQIKKEYRGCYHCKHFKSNPTENECLITRDYCYPAHEIDNCEDFEHYETKDKTVNKLIENL